jgi:hypothetical protein
MRPYIRVLVVVALAAGVTACDEKLSSLAGPTPNLEPTFASVQANVFELTDSAGRPACTNCHNNVGRNPAGNLNLLHDLAYDQLVNRASVERPGLLRVAPGAPDNSYLIHKIVRVAGIVGVRMPLGGPPFLSDGQILIVRRWIELGAPRN